MLVYIMISTYVIPTFHFKYSSQTFIFKRIKEIHRGGVESLAVRKLNIQASDFICFHSRHSFKSYKNRSEEKNSE
jgi:hypothetical protein